MDSLFPWFGLVAGCLLLVAGVRSLYVSGDWVLIVLSMLIVGFSISAIAKKRKKP